MNTKSPLSKKEKPLHFYSLQKNLNSFICKKSLNSLLVKLYTMPIVSTPWSELLQNKLLRTDFMKQPSMHPQNAEFLLHQL